MKARNEIEARVFARLDQLKADGGLDAVIAYKGGKLAHVMSLTPDSPEEEVSTSESENRAVCKWIRRRFGRDVKLERSQRKMANLHHMSGVLIIAVIVVALWTGKRVVGSVNFRRE